jgi:hypothetical protein
MHPPNPTSWRTSRRGFLRLAGATTALTAIAQLRAIPAVGSTVPAERFFGDDETEILTQIVERMVDTGEPDAPPVRSTGTLASIDAVCGTLDPAASGQLPLAIQLFEYGPFLFDFTFSRFTRMSDVEKDASIRAWMTSRLAVRRLAFTAMRNLAVLGYYSQPETWPLIGYRGPLLPKLRGVAS